MFKTLKYMAAAAIMAVLPMTANAAITFGGDISDNDTVELLAGPYSFQSEFTGNEAAGDFNFTFTNLTGATQNVAVTFATINQSPFGAFDGDIVTSWVVGGNSNVTAAGQSDNFTLSTIIAAGASDTLRIVYSAFNSKGASGDIDFVVGAVPLPASVLMFLSALGGMGLIARRRKASVA